MAVSPKFQFTGKFLALLREAGLAAELLGQGVTTIRSASANQKGLYSLALFCLSIGLERVGKMIVIMDRLLVTGKFPTDADLRKLGHSLEDIDAEVSRIEIRHQISHQFGARPSQTVHRLIFENLSSFAKSTRYYNIDFLVGGKTASGDDPVAQWYSSVGSEVVRQHMTKKQKRLAEQEARFARDNLGHMIHIVGVAEDGSEIDNIYDSLIHGHKTRVVQKHTQLYILQIIRHYICVIWEMESLCHKKGLGDVPYLHEFFGLFYNDDYYLKSRKTWLPGRL